VPPHLSRLPARYGVLPRDSRPSTYRTGTVPTRALFESKVNWQTMVCRPNWHTAALTDAYLNGAVVGKTVRPELAAATRGFPQLRLAGAGGYDHDFPDESGSIGIQTEWQSL